MSDEWLKAVGVGTEVAISSDFGYRSYRRAVIERITPTQIVIGQSKYRRADGRKIGDGSWERSYLLEMTDDIRETIEVERLAQLIQKTNWRKRKIGDLRAIAEILRADDRATEERK